MRLFEAILDANHRAVAGDQSAGLHPADFESELPVAALTCVDPRLNALFPDVLGLPGDQFVWLRNAGNIISGPLSSTMRSLALACAVKNARGIAIIGHTDCQVCKTSTMELLDRLKAAGVDRQLLPDNVSDYFGLFASEPQNVIKACDFVRRSPLIGPKIPVHGFVVNIETGKLDWIVNGYQNLETATTRWNEAVKSAGQTLDQFKSLADFQIGEMKFPETKIGESVGKAADWLSQQIGKLEVSPAESAKAEATLESAEKVAKQVTDFAKTHWPQPGDAAKPPPPRLRPPAPPPIRPRSQGKQGGR